MAGVDRVDFNAPEFTAAAIIATRCSVDMDDGVRDVPDESGTETVVLTGVGTEEVVAGCEDDAMA